MRIPASTFVFVARNLMENRYTLFLLRFRIWVRAGSSNGGMGPPPPARGPDATQRMAPGTQYSRLVEVDRDKV
jgi:hypothetical protein